MFSDLQILNFHLIFKPLILIFQSAFLLYTISLQIVSIKISLSLFLLIFKHRSFGPLCSCCLISLRLIIFCFVLYFLFSCAVIYIVSYSFRFLFLFSSRNHGCRIFEFFWSPQYRMTLSSSSTVYSKKEFQKKCKEIIARFFSLIIKLWILF